MTLPTWTITFGANTVDDVQNVNINIGRRKITDPFRSGSITVSGRRPDLLPSIELGDTFSATLTFGGLDAVYTFRVADLKIDYGIVSAMDTWTLEGEDALAYAGRATVSGTVASGSNTVSTAIVLAGYANVTVTSNPFYPGLSSVKAFSLDDANVLELLNILCNTEQGLLGASAGEIQFNGRNWQAGISFYDASDDGTGTNPTVYDNLQFTTLADNYATGVNVTIIGGNTLTSGTGDYTYAFNTYSQTDADATQVAAFVASQLTNKTAIIQQFSVVLNRQTNNTWINLNIPNGVNLKFRGSTYKSFVIGQTLSGTPDSTRITYHVVSAAFYQYLILNDATFGKLDSNRLGF
jgi:hypothetical protein